MSSITVVLAALKTQYEAITLPSPFSKAPTVLTEDPENIVEATLPVVILYDGGSQNITPEYEDEYTVTRIFYANLLCYRNEEMKPSEQSTPKTNTRPCIEAIEDYFLLNLDADFLGTTGVLEQAIANDSGVTTITVGESNDAYIGVQFQHTVTYSRR